MEDLIAGKSEPAAIMAHWQQRYQTRLSDNLDTLDTDPPAVMILAQPRPFAPADLVRLDTWVRGGGRAVILTDPELVWPSDLPFGDPRRPLAIGMLSPLLNHWGLELRLRGGSTASLHVQNVRLPSSGIGYFVRAAQSKDAGSKCGIGRQSTEAICKIGEGKVVLVADADFIHDTFVRAGSPALDVLDEMIDRLLQ